MINYSVSAIIVNLWRERHSTLTQQPWGPGEKMDFTNDKVTTIRFPPGPGIVDTHGWQVSPERPLCFTNDALGLPLFKHDLFLRINITFDFIFKYFASMLNKLNFINHSYFSIFFKKVI